MKLLILLPLLFFFRISNNATLCAVIFTVCVAMLDAIFGVVVPEIIGHAIRSIILAGLYFGFLATLDKEGWAYWPYLVIGGLFLGMFG